MFGRYILAIVLLLPVPAWAWGAEGHEIVASLAAGALKPEARRQIGRLLGSEAMLVHDSNWADEIREQRPQTRTWHFVDIPLGASGYDGRRDCLGGDCVVAQIDRDMRVLANPGLSKGQRAEALRFLIHFVADVHQPLHAEDNGDHGGNAVRVYLQGERTNLHHLWDVSVVEVLGFDAGAVADSIARGVSPAQRKSWQAGTAAGWADESHQLARDEIYSFVGNRRSVRMPPAYLRAMRDVTRVQLAKAGMRLAWLLNRVLG